MRFMSCHHLELGVSPLPKERKRLNESCDAITFCAIICTINGVEFPQIPKILALL